MIFPPFKIIILQWKLIYIYIYIYSTVVYNDTKLYLAPKLFLNHVLFFTHNKAIQ